ncbi:uncharacterized protein LOC120179791 [Hibiscus syriacus]|uniref:uncharacterized protein LOC120179791 n=1 Tax=Hibiscus syriacus TaxID=106335 RepID=UPI001923520D|nr:uncharacterized protein LOC120179791 [Hibiscus syriacus]
MDWRSLFVGVEEQSLDFFPPECREGSMTVVPPNVVFEEGILEWKFSLVGQFIGSAPNFGSLQKLVEIVWGKSTTKHKALVLRKWEPNLKCLDFNLERMLVWIQLFNVPLELFSRKGISYIASALGMPLYMDSITASKERLEFTKVCVKVEARARLPRLIDVRLQDGTFCIVKVVVPWFPACCSKCRIFGHSDKTCNVGGGEGKREWRVKDKASGYNLGYLTREKEDVAMGLTVVEAEGQALNVGQGSAVVEVCELSIKAQSTVGKPSVLSIVEDKANGNMDAKANVSLPSNPAEDKIRVSELPTKEQPTERLKLKMSNVKDKASSSIFPKADGSLPPDPISHGRGKGKKKKNLQFSVLKVDDQTITIQGNLGDRNVYVSTVYGSNSGAIRKELWNQLSEVSTLVGNNIWIVGGDFNVTAEAVESSSFEVGFLSSEIEDLQNCMTTLELMDHHFFGPVFTWSNKHDEGFLARKLDRVLVNDHWCEGFSNSHVEFQAPGVSEHSMVVTWYSHDSLTSRPKPFKYFNFWALHPDFKEVVGKSWAEVVQGDPIQALFCKIKRLKAELRAFNKRFYSNISGKVDEKREQLEKKQIVTLTGGNPGDMAEERKIYFELIDLEKAERLFYQQKAKVDWLLDGDQCTKFFHSQVAVKRKRNTIRIGTEDSNVQGCSDLFLSDLLGYALPAGANVDLVKAVTSDEVRVAIWSQGKDKAPGPDGYTAGFFQSAWDIVGTDFMAAVRFTGFNLGYLPVRYLGFPLVPRKLTEKDCFSLEEKIKAKLGLWSNRWLSYAGRLQLVKSVLLSITNFWCRQFILPKALVRRVNQLCARFFWKGGGIPTKGARVSWDCICSPKSEGGLGLKQLASWNKACILLLVKELLMAEGLLWVAWVRSYVFKGVDLWYVESKPYFIWCIRKILKVREEVQPLFSGIMDWGRINARWLWQEIRGRTVKVEWHKAICFLCTLPSTLSLLGWPSSTDCQRLTDLSVWGLGWMISVGYVEPRPRPAAISSLNAHTRKLFGR